MKNSRAQLSALETQTQFEDQKRTTHELQHQLVDAEHQLIEAEILRKKLHNTILELIRNIRVFCLVHPFLPDDGVGTDASVISYPTSVEGLGQGIDVIQSGKKIPFTFDKAVNHDAFQQDVFVQISQLIQSALDGYKVIMLYLPMFLAISVAWPRLD